MHESPLFRVSARFGHSTIATGPEVRPNSANICPALPPVLDKTFAARSPFSLFSVSYRPPTRFFCAGPPDGRRSRDRGRSSVVLGGGGTLNMFCLWHVFKNVYKKIC